MGEFTKFLPSTVCLGNACVDLEVAILGDAPDFVIVVVVAGDTNGVTDVVVKSVEVSWAVCGLCRDCVGGVDWLWVLFSFAEDGRIGVYSHCHLVVEDRLLRVFSSRTSCGLI